MATASQPASHLATNLTRPISVEAVVTVVPSVLSLPHPATSLRLADSLRSSRGLFLIPQGSLLPRWVCRQHLPANPLILINLLLRENPNPSYKRILVSATKPQDLTSSTPSPPQSLLPCYHAVATATRTTLLSLITECPYSTIRNSLRRGNRLNN